MSAAYLGSFFIISKTRSTEYVCKLIYVVVILDYNTTQVYRIMNIIIILAEVLVSNCAILEAGDLESNFEVAFFKSLLVYDKIVIAHCFTLPQYMSCNMKGIWLLKVPIFLICLSI